MDSHQTEIYIAILISSLLLGAIIVYFFVSLARLQKKNLELARLNILAELSLLEKEHNRMARDLHDELGPLLTAVKYNIASLDVQKEDRYILQRALGGIDEAIHRIREIARDLMPASLTERGLQHALEDFISLLQAPIKITLLYEFDQKLEEENELNIFRLLKEIIQNTIRHSGAQRLVIRLTCENRTLQILSEDDGVGFDYESIEHQKKGIGLRNLRSRAELMGGRLEIFSAKGKGTQYKLLIPLPK